MSGQGQSSTGTPNMTYNLVSVMYHTLQGAETYQKFIQDAESAGNQDVAKFIREIQQQDQQRAQRAQQLLQQQLQQG